MSFNPALYTKPDVIMNLKNRNKFDFYTRKHKLTHNRKFVPRGNMSIRSNTFIQSVIDGKYTATEVDVTSIVATAETAPLAIGVHFLVEFKVGDIEEKFVVRDGSVFGYIALYKRFSNNMENVRDRFISFLETHEASVLFNMDYKEVKIIPERFPDVKEYLEKLFVVLRRNHIVRVTFKTSDRSVDTLRSNPMGRMVTFSQDAVANVFTSPGFSINENYYIMFIGMIMGFAAGFRPQDVCEPWAHKLKENIISQYAAQLENGENKGEEFVDRMCDLEKAFRMHLYRIYTSPDTAVRFRQHWCAFGNTKCILNTMMDVIDTYRKATGLTLDQIFMPQLSTYTNEGEDTISLRALDDFRCERKHGESQSRGVFVLKIIEVMRAVVKIIQSKYYAASFKCNTRGCTVEFPNVKAEVDEDFENKVVTDDPNIVDTLIAIYLPRIIPALSIGTVMSTPDMRNNMNNYLNSCRYYAEMEPSWIHGNLE